MASHLIYQPLTQFLPKLFLNLIQGNEIEAFIVQKIIFSEVDQIS